MVEYEEQRHQLKVFLYFTPLHNYIQMWTFTQILQKNY